MPSWPGIDYTSNRPHWSRWFHYLACVAAFSLPAAFDHQRRHHYCRVAVQVEVTVSPVQPAVEETVQEALNVADVVVDERLQPEFEQPAGLRPALSAGHSCALSCESEVPGTSVKLNGSVPGGGAGTVTH